MSRKVIIDCDPGIDDAVALCLALFDPRLEVLAITAVAGNVSAEQASRNTQAIIDQLDPPRYPRFGAAVPLESAPAISSRNLHGKDGLGNSGFSISQLHHRHPSDKVICDLVRADPDQVTIIALGPLTNIARAFQRDPALPTMVDRIIMMGGSIDCGGNITPAAEFNIYCDPLSARVVFHSPTTKTLVPLDVTRKLALTMDLLEELPDETSRAGGFLHKIIPYAFRAYHQELGQESIFLHDVVALMAALEPALFDAIEMAGDVEVGGEIATGATIFDRRLNVNSRPNMEVAVDMQVDAVADGVIRGLRQAGRLTRS